MRLLLRRFLDSAEMNDSTGLSQTDKPTQIVEDPSQSNAYDVVIIGASIAGCTAATLYARYGLRVALVEKQHEIDSYKRNCTHFILSSATPTLLRLGVIPQLNAAGAIPTNHHIWTKWGWVSPDAGRNSRVSTHGYSINRKTLDPILRKHACKTFGVDYFPGHTLRDIIVSPSGRVTGVCLEHNKELIVLRGNLHIGADGRHSSFAKIVNVPTEKFENNRFCYFVYYRNLPLSTGNDAQMWLADPDIAYCFPNPNGETLVSVMLCKSKYEVFKSDPLRYIRDFVGNLPGAPDFSNAELISEVHAVYDMPLYRRQTSQPGLALIGDAAMATDPYAGAGCGWALQSAEWLVDDTAEALLRCQEVERESSRGLAKAALLDRALAIYSAHHSQALDIHQDLIRSYSEYRSFLAMERMFYCAATRADDIREHFHAIATRNRQPILYTKMILKTLWLYFLNRKGLDKRDYNWQPDSENDACHSQVELAIDSENRFVDR